MLTLPTDSAATKAGYFFDAAKAKKRIDYLTSQFDVTLYKWQRDILATYFGWVNAAGEYRFTKLTTFIGKKNGKSWLISLLLVYKMLELDNARLYSCAYNSKQAGIICDGALNILRRSKAFGAMLQKGKQLKGKCSQYSKEIEFVSKNNKYVSLADSINANDGLIANVMILDEIHRMKRQLIDVCMGATTSIPGSLRVIISTAGDGDKTHPSTQQYQLAKRVLDGKSDDIHLLPAIWECSEEVKTEKEIYDLGRLKAANPVLQEDPEKLKLAIEELAEAREVRNDAWWKRFRLNQWLPQDGNEYIDLDLWQRCEQPDEPDLEGADVYVGVDKGGIWDFWGVTFLFKLTDGNLFERHYTFAVADKLAAMGDKDDTDYQKYVDNGELIIIPADVVMDAWIVEWMLKEMEAYNIVTIGADPSYAGYVMESLISAGHNVIKVDPRNNRLLTPPIEDYYNWIRQGKIKHKANSLIDWQHTCCRKYTTAKDTCKIVKMGSNIRGNGGIGHIDNIDSVVNAIAVYRAAQVSEVTYDGGCVVG